MTERQTKLYTLLNSNTEIWWDQKTICDMIPEYEYKVRVNSKDRCSTILQDKMDINRDSTVDRIIICKNYMFKIATSLDEVKIERNKHIRKLKKQVQLVRDLDKKVSLDKQGYFLDKELNELKEALFHIVFDDDDDKEDK